MKKSKVKEANNPSIYLGDELSGLTSREAAKIKSGLKKQMKKINKSKHIYFNEEWNDNE